MKTLFFMLMLSTSVFADVRLANNGKVVKCNDGDELKLVLSADRKTIKLTIRDNNYGTLPITKTVKGPDFVSYQTKAGELLLMDVADEFIDKWQAYFPDCR